MAKKKTANKTTTRKPAATGRAVSKQRDRETIGKIKGLGEGVVKSSLALKEPVVDIPLRTVSNTRFNKKRRILEMGANKQHRELFNFGQARKFMQTYPRRPHRFAHSRFCRRRFSRPRRRP